MLAEGHATRGRGRGRGQRRRSRRCTAPGLLHVCCVLGGIALASQTPAAAAAAAANEAAGGVADGADNFDAVALLAQASALRLVPGGAGAGDLAQAARLLERVAARNVTAYSRDAHFALAEMHELGELGGLALTTSAPGLAEHHYLQAAAFGSHEALFKLALLDPLQTTHTLVSVVPPEAAGGEGDGKAAGGGGGDGAVGAVGTGTTAAWGTHASPTAHPTRRRHPVQQLSQYQSAALAANPDAAVALGYRYKFGVDVVPNCSLAATYYEFAVNAGMAQFLPVTGATAAASLSADSSSGGGSGGGSSGLDSDFPVRGRRRHGVAPLSKSKSLSGSRARQSSMIEEYYQYSAAGGDPDSQYRLGKLLYAAGIEALDAGAASVGAATAAAAAHPADPAAAGGAGAGVVPAPAGGAGASFLSTLYGGGDEDAGDGADPLQHARNLLQQAAELFSLAAAAGSAEAHAGLGHMYYQGLPHLPRNVTAAMEHFQESADLGNAGGYNGLGVIYYEGVDPKAAGKNHYKALALFAQASGAGHVPGMYNTALMMLQGPPPVRAGASKDSGETEHGIPLRGRDFKKALNFFTAAAARSHVNSLVALAHMHLHGIGTVPNCGLATNYFKVAAEALFVDSKVEAAMDHFDDGHYRKAVLTLNEAAQQGSSGAQLQAAGLYKYHCRQIMEMMDLGSDTAGGTGSARHASSGSGGGGAAGLLPRTLFGWDLADELLDADVLDLVQEVVARWVDVAANAVNGVLQRRVVDNTAATALLRLHPFCSARAIDFLERAAEQDQLASGVELGDLLYDAGTGGGIGGFYGRDAALSDADSDASLQLAAHYYRKAITDGRSARAMFNVGFMHQFGIGLRKDFHLAERYYDMAVATDHRAFAPCQLALVGLQLHRIWDGEALPNYLLVIDMETVLVYILASASFVLGSFWLLANPQ